MAAKHTTPAGRRAEARPEVRAEDHAEADAEEPGGRLAADDGDQAETELAELGAQLPEGAMLTLWRLDEAGEREFVYEQPVAGFTIASVAARFGGGNYVIYLRRPDPNVAGKSFRAGSRRFKIAGPPRYALEAAAPATAATGAAEMEKMLRTYAELIQANVKSSLENQNVLQQMQLAVVRSLSERPPDTSLELLKVLLPQMMGARKDSLGIGDVISLADRLANKTSPAAQLKDTLELVTAARELGGGEGGPAWLPVAEKALGLLERASTYRGEDSASPAAIASHESPSPESDPVPPSTDPLFAWLAPTMPSLVRHAQADHDPDTYAGMLFDQVPPQHAPDVLARLEAPAFPQQFAAAFPMTSAVADWFEELRQCLLSRLRPESGDEAGSQPATSS